MRKVFQAWDKNFKQTKVQRDKEKFDKQVKVELQSISASYQKEIDTLRGRLADAEKQLHINNRNKHMMQENLKKVFMRSVCALNFEAMTILDPADQQFAQQKMEQELQKQMDNALMNEIQIANYPPGPRSEISFNLSENGEAHGHQTTDRDYHQYHAERDLMNLGLNYPQATNQIQQPVPLDENQRKVDSKDSMWKPAPIIGREQMNNMSFGSIQVRPQESSIE